MPSPATRIAAAAFLVSFGLMARELITSPRTDAAPGAPSMSAAQQTESDVVPAHLSAAGEEIVISDAVDAYGNEVTRAVATYQFDATGSLYELHSPRTEVPKLPSPKS